MTHPLDHLPLLARVFSHLTSDQIRDAAKVSKTWRDAGCEPVYWQVKSKEVFAAESTFGKDPREDFIERWGASCASLKALKVDRLGDIKPASELAKITASMALTHRLQLYAYVQKLVTTAPRIDQGARRRKLGSAVACLHPDQQRAMQAEIDSVKPVLGKSRFNRF